MASFKIKYKGDVRFTLTNGVIDIAKIDYRLNVSQSNWMDDGEYTKNHLRYELSKNWDDQSATSIYDLVNAPLFNSEIVPLFLEKLGKGSYSASISVATSSFTDDEYWDDSDVGNNEFPSLPTSGYTGQFLYNFIPKHYAVITVTE